MGGINNLINSLQPILRQPMVDERGIITRAWVQLFISIFSRLAGSSDIATSDDALSLADIPSSMASQLAGLDEIRALIAAIDPPQYIPQPVLLIEDTHANRANYSPLAYPNALYWETDRTVFYLAVGSHWNYVDGTMICTQAALPNDLGAHDVGFIAHVTVYGHDLRWGGSNWDWENYSDQSGQGPVMFEVDPASGWHLYDGSAVTYLKSDGTLGTVTLPDLAGTAAYLKAGSPPSGPNAAVAPTASPSTTGSGTANIGVDNGGGTTFATGTAGSATAAAHTHNHTDSGHTHSIPAIIIGTNGEPRNLVRKPWFRI